MAAAPRSDRLEDFDDPSGWNHTKMDTKKDTRVHPRQVQTGHGFLYLLNMALKFRQRYEWCHTFGLDDHKEAWV